MSWWGGIPQLQQAHLMTARSDAHFKLTSNVAAWRGERVSTNCMDMHMQYSCSRRARMSPLPHSPLSSLLLQLQPSSPRPCPPSWHARILMLWRTWTGCWQLTADLDCRHSPPRSCCSHSGEPPTIWLTLYAAYERVGNGFNFATSLMSVSASSSVRVYACGWFCWAYVLSRAALGFASFSVRYASARLQQSWKQLNY